MKSSLPLNLLFRILLHSLYSSGSSQKKLKKCLETNLALLVQFPSAWSNCFSEFLWQSLWMIGFWLIPTWILYVSVSSQPVWTLTFYWLWLGFMQLQHYSDFATQCFSLKRSELPLFVDLQFQTCLMFSNCFHCRNLISEKFRKTLLIDVWSPNIVWPGGPSGVLGAVKMAQQ